MSSCWFKTAKGASYLSYSFKSKQTLQMNAQRELRNIFLKFLVLFLKVKLKVHFVCHLVGSNPQSYVQRVQNVQAVQNAKRKIRERLFSLYLVGSNSQGEI